MRKGVWTAQSKSVTEDGLRQVRDMFNVNSLNLLLVFFMIEYSQIQEIHRFIILQKSHQVAGKLLK